MSNPGSRIYVSLLLSLLTATGLATAAFAQETPYFTPGNIVVSVEGCGVNGGTCTSIPKGTGNGTGNSSNTGYGDNQAAPLTLFQYAPNGTSSVTFVNSLELPQTGSGANVPVSGEYGSSSEGSVQLSGLGQYLTMMGYGVNANTFNANPNQYSAAPNSALAQSGSMTGQGYTPIPRVVTLIDAYGNVNSSTELYNVFDNNNPRSAYTADGVTGVYVSGQGTGCDQTGGVFLSALGLTNNAPTPITGGDAVPTSTCVASGYSQSTVAQDTRTVQVYNGTLYVSVDSTEGKSNNRSYLGTLGTPPATSAYVPAAGTFPSGYTDGPSQISGIGNSGGTGKESITAATANGVNSSGLQVNLSPENYFFASPTVLYIADGGSPKQSSATSLLGAGGLQKWVKSGTTWTWEYTLYKGLNLVANSSAVPSNTSGTTGLLGLTGVVSGNTVYLYSTNYTINDLDPSYLYGITDTLSATTNPGTSFTQLAAAPQDSNFKGVSLAPSLPAGSATITSTPSGLAFSTSGTGCVPGTYTTPVTLVWTPGSSCELSVATPQGATGTQYAFEQWQDGTTANTDFVTAPSTSASYTLSFSTSYQLNTSAATGGTVSAGGYFTSGSDATVTATPAAGYYFVNFTGTTTSTSNPLTVAMNGPQSITANFAPFTSTSTRLTSSSYPSVLGQAVTFTAAVTPGSGSVVPSGTVQFSIDGAAVGSPVALNASGIAAYTTSALPVGNYFAITAAYTPAAGALFQPSTSATLNQTVYSSARQSEYAHFTNALTVLGSGFSRPYGVAVDASDNVFVADTGNSAVKEMMASSGYTTINTLGSGFISPTGIAVDTKDNLFVSDVGNGTVFELTAGNYSTVNPLGESFPFSWPYGVAVDANDNVFVASTGSGTVWEIGAVNAYIPPIQVGRGVSFQYPWGIAVDANDNVFVSDVGTNSVQELIQANNYTTASAVGAGFFDYPYGLALDANNDLFVADPGYAAVREVSQSDGFTSIDTAALGLNIPIGVAVDSKGNLFVADTDNNLVKEFSQSGGNFGSISVGSTSPSPITLTFTFDASTTLGSVVIYSPATNSVSIDFPNTLTGTCTANTAYAANSTCAVIVNFSPFTSGTRTAVVELLDGSGNVLAAANLQGVGVTPPSN